MFLFSKSNRLYHFLILFVGLSLVSCDGPKSKLEKYGPVFTDVMVSDTGAFRGLNLGINIDSVKKMESAQPSEIDSNYLYYEYALHNSAGSFDITYDFNETGLNEIHSDVFLTNSDQTDSVFSNFKAFFTDHYGQGESHMGFAVWMVKSDKYGNVRINLSDESADFTAKDSPGKISLWIYPEQN